MKNYLFLMLFLVCLAACLVNAPAGILGNLVLLPMLATGLSAPTEAATGFPFAELTKVFKKRCKVYFAVGKFSGTGDDNYPAAKADVLSLVSGGTFQPLGMMDAAVGKIGFKRNNEKTDFYTIPTDVAHSFELNSVRVYPDMLAWLDTDEAKGELTLLFVPDGDDGSIFLALNGVGVTPEGDLSLGGGLCKIKFANEKQANNITDVILYETFSA